jgi:hypothetical protein
VNDGQRPAVGVPTLARIANADAKQNHEETKVRTTAVYDSYWNFAAERLNMYYRRLSGGACPWTADAVLQVYRFTNTYRAADRVSQFLIREVQYGEGRSQSPDELFFRTILFKLFNKIETWTELERVHGPVATATFDFDAAESTLDRLSVERTIYSAAYIMPAPPFGAVRKHANHLRMLERMMADRLPGRIRQAPDLQTVYELLRASPGLGRFLAFQFAIDLNYSAMLDFDEASFVVAGPGALDGISKCFEEAPAGTPEQIIHWMVENQHREFAARGIDFPGLFGRPLQPIDCQNLFCEISKYSRVAHPEVRGLADRKRIKQIYRAAPKSEPPPFFPPDWNLRTDGVMSVPPVDTPSTRFQFRLL